MLIKDAAWQAAVIGQTGLRPWLQERGSLTARLKRQYADFSVHLLSQAWDRPHPDELSLLDLPMHRHAWVREVLLLGDGEPRVFAHSVISRQDMRSPWRGLRRIGRAPLGAALFADPRVRRGALHFYKLPLTHPLRKTLVGRSIVHARQTLWARRSLFLLGRHRLLVTEVFLPAGPSIR